MEGAAEGSRGKLIAAVGALYWKRPTAAEVAEFGCRPEDYPEPDVQAWPEAWPSIQLFARNSTQWRVGMGGPVGLDYGVIHHELDRMALAPDEYEQTLAYLRVIEQAALEQIHKD